ncbi:MAG: hypothetical protein ACLTRJ_09195 [Bifidobacterium longum]
MSVPSIFSVEGFVFYAEFSVFALNSNQWFDEFGREIILVGCGRFRMGDDVQHLIQWHAEQFRRVFGRGRFAPMLFEYFLAFETAYAHDSPLP